MSYVYEYLQEIAREEENRSLQIKLAGTLTITDVQRPTGDRPRASESLPLREAAAAAVDLRVLDRIHQPRLPRFDSPEWVRAYAKHIDDPAVRALMERFIDLVDACKVRLNVGPNELVLYQSVLDLGSELNLVAQTARPSPAPVAVVAAVASDGVEPDSAVPGWGLKSIERSPGYRWPLRQVLQAAHKAGKPCPKAREVLEVWRLNPPAELGVMSDGVKYNTGVGKQKEANLKAIQQAIKNLVK